MAGSLTFEMWHGPTFCDHLVPKYKTMKHNHWSIVKVFTV